MTMNGKRFGVVSDEIHPDPEVAFRVASELGMGHVDLNSLWGKAVTDLTAEEVAQVKALADRYGLEIRMVAGGTFKTLVVAGLTGTALLRSEAFGEHMEVLTRSMEIAKALNAPLVRVFSFRWPHMKGFGNPSPRYPGGGKIPPDEFDTAIAGLRAACELARRSNLVLGLENVRSCYGNSGQNTGRIVDAVGDDRLKVVWDPANAFVSGEEHPYPDGYSAVCDHMVHFHVKDARVVDEVSGLTAWECVGRGSVAYEEHFEVLAAEYDGGITLETHWCPEGLSKEEASRRSFAGALEIWNRVTGASSRTGG